MTLIRRVALHLGRSIVAAGALTVIIVIVGLAFFWLRATGWL